MADEKQSVDRREFIQVSAVAGLAAVTSSASNTAEAQASPEPGILDQPAGSPLRVRRIVTGHHADGQSYVAIDEIPDNINSRHCD